MHDTGKAAVRNRRAHGIERSRPYASVRNGADNALQPLRSTTSPMLYGSIENDQIKRHWQIVSTHRAPVAPGIDRLNFELRYSDNRITREPIANPPLVVGRLRDAAIRRPASVCPMVAVATLMLKDI